jgi:CubicO group peptidase (beta-lactamase class C family)
MRIHLCVLFCVLHPALVRSQGLPRVEPEVVGLSGAALARIRPALQAQVDSGRVAGFVVAVARHGKLAFLDSVGFMDRERGLPMRSDAAFEICSLSKPVTAVAVLQLYERGRLRLDDPVSKYIPAFGRVRVYAGGPAAAPRLRDPDAPITIAHLLTHTSGLTYGVRSNTPVDTIYRSANLLALDRTLAQVVDTLARLPLLFSPGSEWHYGMSFDVLARVVEVVSGRPFDRYLEQELFAPLGMGETGFHLRGVTEDRLVTLYVRGADGRLRAAPSAGCTDPSAETRFLSGGAGLVSTPGDYLRFAQMLLNGGELDGHRVLRRQTVSLLLRNELPPAIARIPFGALGQSGYGQGFVGAVLVDSLVENPPGAPGIYRWWGYAQTYFWIDPTQDLVAVLWSQFTPGSPDVPLAFQRLVYAALKPR